MKVATCLLRLGLQLVFAVFLLVVGGKQEEESSNGVVGSCGLLRLHRRPLTAVLNQTTNPSTYNTNSFSSCLSYWVLSLEKSRGEVEDEKQAQLPLGPSHIPSAPHSSLP